MLIKACLNGAREVGAHPALPVTPRELAEAARAAVAVGAGALHIHPRRGDGSQSLAAEEIAAALTAVRAACPGVPVGASTLFTIEPDPAGRVALIQLWTVRPDFVSVNLAEPGTAELWAALRDVGIGIEAGLSTAADTELLLQLGLAGSCMRILIEPDEESVEEALATAASIEALLEEAAVTAPRLLHGFGLTAWPLLDAAIVRGYDTRIGLEDVLILPDGSQARDNAELVEVAHQRAAALVGATATRFGANARGEVIETWEITYPDPIVVRAGERVSVGRRDTEWPFVWCTTSVGVSGWLPDRYLEIEGDEAVVRFHYNASELGAEVGEVVALHHEESGWIWATNSAGASGWIPVRNLRVTA